MKTIVHPWTISKIAGSFVNSFQFLRVDWKLSEEADMLLGAVFDKILLVIGVQECWEVVFKKKMLPLFGTPWNYGPVWVKEPLPLPYLGENRGSLGRGFCFIVSFGATGVSCFSYWIRVPKNSSDFDDNNSAPVSFLKVWAKQHIRIRSVNKSFRILFGHCFNLFLVIYECN